MSRIIMKYYPAEIIDRWLRRISSIALVTASIVGASNAVAQDTEGIPPADAEETVSLDDLFQVESSMSGEESKRGEGVRHLHFPLVIWGELDFPLIKERCQYLVTTIRGANGKEILGTAHLLNLEKPEVINGLLQAFLI